MITNFKTRSGNGLGEGKVCALRVEQEVDKGGESRFNRRMKYVNFRIVVALLAGLAPSFSSVSAKSSRDSFPVPKKGGVFRDVAFGNPVSLVPLLITVADDRLLASKILMPLMPIDYDTYENIPGLAEKCDVSVDRKEYTYTLNAKAKWSDGTPVTSDDMVFTFEKIMDPKVNAGAVRAFLPGMSIEKLDARRFKFKVESPQYDTEQFLGTLYPIQKKQFENEKDFNTSAQQLKPIGTNAYKLKQISRDQFVTLERDPNWWAKDMQGFRQQGNFDQIQVKIIQDNALRYESFVKGELDTLLMNSDQFALQVKGADKDKYADRPGTSKPIWAKALPSEGSLPWGGVAFNLTHPVFVTLKTRQALAHLVDYDRVIKEIFFGLVARSVSPFGSKGDNVSPGLRNLSKAYRYDPKKAAQLLKDDGWRDSDGDGVLDREVEGKSVPFRFVLKAATSNASAVKFAQYFKEELKKSGIVLEVKTMDFAAMFKDFDDQQFDAMLLSWSGGSIFPNPRQLWASSSIKDGSNKVQYSNLEVDALISKANLEFNRKKRSKILQQIGDILYHDVPYLFLYERNAILQGFNSKLKSPRWIGRYGLEVEKDLFHY